MRSTRSVGSSPASADAMLWGLPGCGSVGLAAASSVMTASTAARRTFVLETLLAAATDRRDDATRLSAACARLGGCRGSIAYLGALVVPEDELVLHLIEAWTSAGKGTRRQ